MDLEGKTLAGRYVIGRKLGSGGMGAVYAATDSYLGRALAIKALLLADAPEARIRFLREARAVARLEHRNIVRIYDADDSHEIPYIAMELIDGTDGRSLIAGGPPLAAALDVAAQMLHGLGFAHEHGVVHRDVKPANVLINRDGVAKLIDFGLARLGDDRSDITKGRVFGSAAYMAPEQITTPHDVDRRADIYSAGVFLFQMVTGKLPFDCQTVAESLIQTVRQEAPDPRALVASCPAALAELIGLCLRKDRAGRPDSASELARQVTAIATALSSPALLAPPPAIPPFGGRASQPLAVPPIAADPVADLATDEIRDLPISGYSGDADAPPTIALAQLRYDGEDPLPEWGTAGPPPTAAPVSSRASTLVPRVIGVLLLATLVVAAVIARRGRPAPGASGLPTLRLPDPSSGTARPTPDAGPLRAIPVNPPASQKHLKLHPGDSLVFRISLAGTGSSSAKTRWTLNDDPVGEGTSYAYRASAPPHRDSVTVGTEGTILKIWSIEVF
jgi:serine/threonine protein kinase